MLSCSVTARSVVLGLLATRDYRSQLRPLAAFMPRRRFSPFRWLSRRPAALLTLLARLSARGGASISAPISASDALAALGFTD